jgi:glutamate-1-semialdehyde 2,1-aminomutase
MADTDRTVADRSPEAGDPSNKQISGLCGLARLLARETELFKRRTANSASLAKQSKSDGLPNGVPMPWMTEWHTPYAVYVASASGSTITDVDGNKYVDFCLGDTGTMFGHSPPATSQAVIDQIRDGITTMLPTEDAGVVARELAHRFGLTHWQFAISATDANRFVIRICRILTGRPKVLVFDQCYHGSLDETLGHIENGQVARRTKYDTNPAVPPSKIARIVEFNDVESLERELAEGDVACEPGFHERLRELTRQHNVYLVVDETHTFSSGPGGYTAAHGLEPDFITLGKAIAGGVPAAAYGFSSEIAEKMANGFAGERDTAPMGIGGTLAGNALSIRAIRATLENVATEEAFEHMIQSANRLADGIEGEIAAIGLPWSVTRCGARVELQFAPNPPRTGAEAKLQIHWDLLAFIHLYLVNRGVLLTPFHNMMLVSPVTDAASIDQLVSQLKSCMGELVGLDDFPIKWKSKRQIQSRCVSGQEVGV